MRAHRLYGQRDLRLETESEPDLQAGELRVKVAYSGICGTDVHYFYNDDDKLPNRPRHIGHEFAGTVTETAEGVRSVAVGDRVAVFPLIACGECSECLAERPVHCERYDRSVSTVGCGSLIGGIAESVVIPESLAFTLPDGLSLLGGSLMEPLSVSATAVRRSGIGADGVAVVLGAGMIGIGAILALKAAGVQNIVVAEVSDKRRENLQSIAGLTVVNPAVEDVRAIVHTLSNGVGADVVYECAGVHPTLDIAMDVARMHGQIIIVAMQPVPYPVDMVAVSLRELSIVGHNSTTRRDFAKTAHVLEQGILPIEDWVTIIDFERVLEEGIDPSKRGELVKAVIEVPQ